MSPRRKIDGPEPDFFTPVVREPRRWGLPVLSVVAGLLIAAAIGAATFMLVQHETDRRTQLRDASALGYVRGFMTAYTSLDPFNANGYTDRMMEQATGEFATQFAERKNEILIEVARSEPSTGSVLEAGVERWNADGSADVLVATKVTTRTPDGTGTVESGGRWLATVVEEGQQWKISQLLQVI